MPIKTLKNYQMIVVDILSVQYNEFPFSVFLGDKLLFDII